MRVQTVVPIRTFFPIAYVRTHRIRVELSLSFPILRIVVVDAVLMVVGFGVVAGSAFEVGEVEILGKGGGTLIM